jgi:hypothetical protein
LSKEAHSHATKGGDQADIQRAWHVTITAFGHIRSETFHADSEEAAVELAKAKCDLTIRSKPA